MKCSIKEDPLGGLQDLKEEITKDRAEQGINKMTEPVRGNRTERKSKLKDEKKTCYWQNSEKNGG